MVVNRNNSKIYVWLSDGLMNDLKIKLKEYNEEFIEDKNLTLPVAAYFVNLPNYILSTKKDKYEDGWAPICSEIIKQIGQYERYMEFLTTEGFLECNNSYSSDAHYCKKYRLAKRYRNQVAKQHKIKAHSGFCQNRWKFYEQRMKNAQESTPHLTKWLDKFDLLEIDYKSAEDYIKKTYKGSHINKRNVRQMTIDMIKDGLMKYSREGNDNRLHSLLTSLASDLRPFVRFDGKPLISLDIASSQPFILSSILYHLIYTCPSPLSSSFPLLTSSSSIMFHLIVNPRGIDRFIDKVLSGEFYSSFGDTLYKAGLLYSNIDEIYYLDKDLNETFESRRNAAKSAIMRILYSSSGNNENIVRVFNKTYPEVGEVVKELKTKNKSVFPILMQNIEADFLLDYCTKEIALKHPEMPLFTIHDSILSTEDNIQALEEEFYKLLKDYFVISPRLKREYWSEQFIDNEFKKTA